MKRTKILIVLAGLLLLVSGCNRDSVVDSNNQTPIVTNSKKGLYILSEGSMSVPNSSKLSFYDFDSTFYENIFKPTVLGNAPDGMVYDGNNLLITEQGNYNSPGKIYRVDTGGTVISSQSAGVNPYSLCIANNKIYLTNGPANNVSVLDYSTLATIKTVNVGIYPQEILAYNNKVFVCNTSNWGGPYDSTVSVIDATKDSVVARIVLRREVSSIALSRHNNLLIGCNGPTGYLYVVNPSNYAVMDSFSFADVGGFGKDISIDNSTDDIFFITYANEIASLNLTSRIEEIEIHNHTPNNNYFYGYIFDSKRKRHYVADALTFTSSGLLHIYSNDNVLLKSYYTGYAPRRMMLLDN